ncbi:hypothetical protein ACLB2K_028766 [Fragaria x ananassa]
MELDARDDQATSRSRRVVVDPATSSSRSRSRADGVEVEVKASSLFCDAEVEPTSSSIKRRRAIVVDFVGSNGTDSLSSDINRVPALCRVWTQSSSSSTSQPPTPEIDSASSLDMFRERPFRGSYTLRRRDEVVETAVVEVGETRLAEEAFGVKVDEDGKLNFVIGFQDLSTISLVAVKAIGI